MEDWTEGNKSAIFIALCREIERLIRDDSHMLISGRADSTAQLILGNLAHRYDLQITTKTIQELMLPNES